MTETTLDLASFFETAELSHATYVEFADAAYSSFRARERFEDLVKDYRRRVDAGQGEPLRLALGYLILERASDALEFFSKAPDNKIRHYYAAQASLALGRYDDATKSFTKAAAKGWDEFEIDMQLAATHLRAGDRAPAEQLAKKHARRGEDQGDWHYVNGLLREEADDRGGAIESYEKALVLSPDHTAGMFRCARLYDIEGQEDKAIELYRLLALQPRAHVNALINLAVVYDDQEEYDDAIDCLNRVLKAHPNHARARLFLKDAESSRQMVIDEAIDRQADTRDRLLSTPIGEFELSVRARNCLKKMRINTLGDLLRLSEAELLAYKNFGETSLSEIRGLLTAKGLRLGQRPDEIDPATIVVEPRPAPKVVVPPGSEAALSKSVAELELSVRARRCLQRLNIVSLAELIQHSESDLLSTRNFGVTSLNEIKARLTDLGLSLAPKR